MAEEREASELPTIGQADAWFEYLEATRGEAGVRYEELESWAWARLRQRLGAGAPGAERLRPAA